MSRFAPPSLKDKPAEIIAEVKPVPKMEPTKPETKPEEPVISNRLPGTDENGMYMGRMEFAPASEDRVTHEDLVHLFGLLGMWLDNFEHFNRLPETVKSHFVLRTRQGKLLRYGSREYNEHPISKK